MEHFLLNNIADDISEESTDSDFSPEDLLHLMNNHPDMPLDAEEMEDYIEDIVELYEMQYRRRLNESGDPPNILVIRHLVEHERDVLFNLPDNVNGFQNQFQNLQLNYQPASSGGDMPQFFLEEEDIQNVTAINIMLAKKVRLVKRRYKTTKRTSMLNLRKSRKNRFKSESSIRKKLQTYRRQSDFYIRRYSNW